MDICKFRMNAVWMIAVMLSFVNLGMAAFEFENMEFTVNSKGIAQLAGIKPSVAKNIVIPAVAIDGVQARKVSFWLKDALAFSADVFAEDALLSIGSEDAVDDTQTLVVRGECIVGWPKLESVEFPAQLVKVDCDVIRNCPSLQQVTIRSNKVIEFDSPYSSGPVSFGDNAVLYVQDALIPEYEELKENGSADAKAFLQNFAEIKAIPEELPSGVHLVVGDLHMNLRDAKPGDKITIQAPQGEKINSITANDREQQLDSDTSTQITIPEFDRNMVLAVNLSSNHMSSVVSVETTDAVSIVARDGGIDIVGYDGSAVTVIDFAGRVVRSGHYAHIDTGSGCFILLYHGRGHKIIVK